MGERWKRRWGEWKLLLQSMPAWVVVMFVLAVVAMNLLANKSIDLPVDWLALDCGILASWAAFLAMDMITKHFGPMAASQLSVFAAVCNLGMCLVLALGSAMPGRWGESDVPGSQGVINAALNHTFGGVWYVVAGSTAAFLVSALVNNFSNWAIGQALGEERDGFGVYAVRSYLSTALGQFVDNLVFALVVSHVFFGWSLLQCVTCAVTGMGVELLCEAVFSGVGFRICQRWKVRGVGRAYLDRKGR